MMAAIEKPSRRVDSDAAGGQNDINNEPCPYLLAGFEKRAAAWGSHVHRAPLITSLGERRRAFGGFYLRRCPSIARGVFANKGSGVASGQRRRWIHHQLCSALDCKKSHCSLLSTSSSHLSSVEDLWDNGYLLATANYCIHSFCSVQRSSRALQWYQM